MLLFLWQFGILSHLHILQDFASLYINGSNIPHSPVIICTGNVPLVVVAAKQNWGCTAGCSGIDTKLGMYRCLFWLRNKTGDVPLLVLASKENKNALFLGQKVEFLTLILTVHKMTRETRGDKRLCI